MAEEGFTGRDEGISFGKDYEYLMAAYYGLVFSLNDKIKDLKISSNNKAMGDFDDVVIELELDNGEEHLFALQLKHQDRQIAQYTLVSGNKKFSLQKYHGEFEKIKNSYHKNRFHNISFENFHFILFTTSNLEKEDEFNEEWKQLKPKVNGNVVETDFLIKKCDNVFGRELFAVPASEDEFVFCFKSREEDSTFENFFQQFYFYTRQKRANDVEHLIADLFRRTFKNCEVAAAITYVNYINYWCRGDYGPHKLTKKDICLKITELICLKYLPDVDISRLNYVPNDRAPKIVKMFQLFDIVIVEDPNDEVVDKIWVSLLQEYVTCAKKLEAGWSTPFSSVYFDFLTERIDVPISAYGDNFNQLSLKRIYVTLWHYGLYPLVVDRKKNPDDTQDISQVIRLCKTNNAHCNFLLLGGSDYFEEQSSWRILRNLLDVSTQSKEIYSVIENFIISIQGRPCITLKEFIETDTKLISVITTKEILLMMNDSYIFGKDCKQELPKYYISRKFPKILIDIKAINEVRNDLFIVSTSEDAEFPSCGIDFVDIQKYLFLKESGYPLKLPQNDPSNWFFIVAKGGCDKQQFEEICSLNQDINCQHVRLIDGERIEWIQSRGSIDKLQKYRSNFDDFVKDEDALVYFDNKINILCADPGMGKSVVMNFLHFICPSQYWVINVQLRKHTIFFKERRSKEEILKYFLSLESGDLFTKKVVDILASKKQILFLWDGFDEVPLEYNSFVIAAIKTLAEEGFLQWLSARTNSKNFLEQTFNTFSLTLPHFDKQNQYDYVYHHLKEKYKDESKVEELIDKIDENLSSLLNCGYVDYTGIPLQIRMLTEIYLEQKYDEESPNFVTLTDIYQEFILGKFNSLFQRADADFENVYMQAIREQYVNIHLDIYETAAIKTTFDAEDLIDVNFNCGNFLEEIKENKDALDLILDVNEDGSIFFAHKTYEEFLAASWLSKHCHQYPRLVKILFQEKYTNIRMMFDMILAKDSAVHLAVLYKNLDVLKTHENDIEDSKDRCGRNALHLACSWGRRHPLLQIMKEGEEIEFTQKTREDNYNSFTTHVALFKEFNINIPELEKVKLHDSTFDSANNTYCKIYEQKFSEQNITDGDVVKINVEKQNLIAEEDSMFLEILQYLLTHKCKPLEKDDLLNWNAFEYADCSLSLAAIDVLIKLHPVELGVLQNYKDIPTVVHYSVLSLYDNLLKAIAEIPYIEYHYQFGTVTLLQLASEVNNLFGVSELLKYPHYKQVINAQSAFFNNPLGSAVFQGNLDMVNLLLENGGKVNGHKLPLLMAASCRGRVDLCEKLLEAGGEVNATSSLNGFSPLLISIITRNIEITKLLLENGADVNYVNNDSTALTRAIGIGSLDFVELILQHGPNINHQCEKLGYTPLHEATEFGFLDIVKLLLKHGADATLKSKKLMTPLHIALYNKHKEVAIELINKAPSVANDCDDDGLDPVMLATIRNFPEIIELFIKYGADLNCSEAELSPLCYAAVHNFDSCARALIEGGASVNQASSDGMYPIMCSAENITTLRILLGYSADVNVKNKNGITALHLAICGGNKDCVEELIKNGASINSSSEFSQTPLLLAVHYKQLEIMKLLLDKGAEFGDGTKLINAANTCNFFEAIPILVERGADINAKDELGRTPLYRTVATMYKQAPSTFDNVKVLLENGADPNITCGSILSNLAQHFNISELDSPINEDYNNITWRSKVSSILSRFVKDFNDSLLNFFIILEKSGLLSPLHWTASQGDILTTVLLIANGADVNITDHLLRTPLHACLDEFNFQPKNFTNTEDCLKELLSKGAQVNHQDVEGRTPLHKACSHGYSKIIRSLVENEADVNISDNQKRSPLHFCFFFGDFENADFLIQNGAELDVKDLFGLRPVDYAMEWITTQKPENIDLEVLRKVLGWGADINYRSEKYGSALLHVTAEGGQCSLVRFLLENGADIESKYCDCLTALYFACKNNHKEVVSLLLEKNCKVNVTTVDGNTPLHIAVENGDDEIVRMLIAAGGDVNIANCKQITPLHLASKNNCVEIVSHLLKNNSQVNIQNLEGFTPLHYAAFKGFPDISQILLEAGANFDIRAKDDYIPLQLACQCGNCQTVEIFLQYSKYHKTQVNKTGDTLLHLAVAGNNAEVAKLLIEKSVDINQKNFEGWTPVYDACCNGNVTLIKILQENGADLFVENKTRDNLLTASSEHFSVIKYLTENGLNVNHKNEDNVTPLYNACICNNYDGASYLIENGADVNAATKNENMTPLYAASARGHVEVAKLLLFLDANFMIKPKNNFSPLSVAASEKKIEILELFAQELMEGRNGIVDRSEIINDWKLCFMVANYHGHLEIVKFIHGNGLSKTSDELGDGYTGLHYACLQGKLEVVSYLLDNSADVNAKTNEGYVPLRLIASEGHIDIAKLLVENGAEVDSKCSNGNTPLFAAAAHGFLEIVEYLYSRGADVTVVDKDGDTPLHDAACHGHFPIVQFLVSKDAQVNLKNNKGKTPLDLAVERKHAEIEEYLKSLLQQDDKD